MNIEKEIQQAKRGVELLEKMQATDITDVTIDTPFRVADTLEQLLAGGLYIRHFAGAHETDGVRFYTDGCSSVTATSGTNRYDYWELL